MFVKICGTTNLEDAQLAVTLGADALGFIFAPSKRRITAERTAEITQVLPDHLLRVGIFTDPDTQHIADTVRTAGLTAVQMHWNYDPALVTTLRERLSNTVQLWQVVGYVADAEDRDTADELFAEVLQAAMLNPLIDAVLLDSIKAGTSGGLGEPFSWQHAEPLVQGALAHAEAKIGRAPRIVLAGGLRPENVQGAIQTLQPWGVDVVSGVEAGPGKKSPDRLQAFLQAAKQNAP